ncbi:hypothetical protein [Ferroacidibacillus organovorans]|uniref:hypothetical protein n=1 Tax=Ferroacidibacillus organovorans TaxID=1765683 RepID=UPI0012E7A1AA|nr:hypothetical protein [Ferroacidibacillus organovorans]
MNQSISSIKEEGEGVTASVGTFGLVLFLAIFFYFFTRPGTLPKPQNEPQRSATQ